MVKMAYGTSLTTYFTLESMNDFTAIGLAEGWIPADSEDQVIEAWQHLHDTGLAYKLQGWFGRTAKSLLEQNIIEHHG